MSEVAAFLTRQGDQVDDYYGEMVADPYRWLEDTYSAETTAWVAAQNARTEAFLAGLPQRQQIKEELSRLWDYPKADSPFEMGGRWFQWRNSGLQDQAVLYLMSSPQDAGEPLLDPNSMSKDGTVSVTVAAVTDDGGLLAYATSDAGSDWKTWHVRDVLSGQDRPDIVEWAKYSGAAWRKDGSGFYFTAAEKPEPGAEYTGKTGLLRVVFHALGTDQAQDETVFEEPSQPEWSPYGDVSEDGRFLIISISKGTALETRIEIADLEQPGTGRVVLVPDFSCQASVVTNVGTTFFLMTDDQAERRRLVAVDLAQPARADWREVVPEQPGVLIGALNCGGKLVCHYLEDACSRLSVYDVDGTLAHHVAVPEASSVDEQIWREATIAGRAGSPLFHFGVQSFIASGSIWSHNVATGRTLLVQGSLASLDSDALVTERVFVTADDGARIPLFLTRRRDLSPTGDVAVLLYGYGGFDIAITPWFNRAMVLFAQRGGMLAVASLRGGGEYGRSWHDAGRLAHKERAFDDFCDCARWLVSSGWSQPQHIGINGASNGGLLVGACLTRHPELFGAAVPEVGVLDMLRFHQFTIGWAWKSDFGDPDDPEQFRTLRAYSPLHNIKTGERYPPTLVMTGDHDDRVVPGHSFKFTAALQAAQAAQAAQVPEAARAAGASSATQAIGASPEGGPLLIRVETSAGHGMGKPTSKAIAERADALAFLEWALNGTDGLV